MDPVVAAVIVALISVNALYVAAEFAAVSVRRSRLQQLAENGDALAARLLPVVLDGARLDRYIAACQIGITISSLVLGAYGQATLAGDLAPLVERFGQLQVVTAQSVAAIVVLVLLTVLQMVLGELVPKSIALRFPTPVARATVVPLIWSMRAMRWLIVLLNGSGVAVLRLLGMPGNGHRHIHSPSEIEYLIAESRDGGQLDATESTRLRQALRLGMRTAGELMIPRPRIVAVDVDTEWTAVVELLRRTPFSRIPVYEDSIDHVIGILHARDVARRALDGNGTAPRVRDLLRPVLIIPESMAIDRLLTTLRAERKALAIVADEFGGTAGLIAVGDLLDELLGDTADEFRPSDTQPQRLPDGRLRIAGRTRVDEAAPWIGIHLETDAYTLGGFVMERLGRVPIVGDDLRSDGLTLVVEQMSGRAVETLLVTPLPTVTDDE
jgi:putative hemolysin